MKNLYFVVIDWNSEDSDDILGPNCTENRIIPVYGGDTALAFAHDIAYTEKTWITYGSPCNVYIYSVRPVKNEYKYAAAIADTFGWDDSHTFVASYPGCDKYAKF